MNKWLCKEGFTVLEPPLLILTESCIAFVIIMEREEKMPNLFKQQTLKEHFTYVTY